DYFLRSNIECSQMLYTIIHTHLKKTPIWVQPNAEHCMSVVQLVHVKSKLNKRLVFKSMQPNADHSGY
ncbi:MAG: hypothetical protein N0E48_22840, partial [Candidatus Thiodiazotropha endolucinida]|nr:hypothetical protein [Candidatus Thiodiazotropha taylori]MCW4346171.1 hypothetical protein [Candidatus Thiodiazotropha endolucinida]